MPLTILTLNIWHDQGPWAQRCQRLRAWLDRLDPDVVSLQEVLRGPTCDQLAELFAGRGHHLDFEPATVFWRDTSLSFGNAVASRFPIRDRAALRLPESGDHERRVALSVTIETPHGLLGFTTTHLNWKLHHGYVREKQVVALAAFSRARRPGLELPPVIAGDLNAEPDSAEIRFLTGLQSLAGKSALFYDAWRVAGDGSPGFTWSNRNPYARVAIEPDRRIDYVLAGYPQASGVGRLESCRVVCDDEVAGVWPTDHFGVIAEIRTEPIPGLGAWRAQR
jgi:endonuclease/exonuclease/phosphatase family metal-dependent hydrolase